MKLRRDLLARSDLQPTARYFEESCRASRMHDQIAQQALRDHGDHGADISGIVREHFPDSVKSVLRFLARAVTAYSDAAYESRPPRLHHSTIRALGRAVAMRDGSGFYGPRA